MGYYNYNGGGYGRSGFFSNVPPVVKNIILLNALIYLLTLLTGDFMYEKFSLFYIKSPLFHWWQIVTHMFMHGGFFHLFFNMYTLFFFGCVLERVWGAKKFLFFYFVTGLGAAALHMGVMGLEALHYSNMLENGIPQASASYYRLLSTPTVGASGAIYGVLLGYGMLFPQNVIQMVFPPVALKAKWFVVIFAVIELLLGVFGTSTGVAHFAHLGGMLFGWLLIMYWKRNNRMYYEG